MFTTWGVVSSVMGSLQFLGSMAGRQDLPIADPFFQGVLCPKPSVHYPRLLFVLKP